jgi:hypothetical protein
MTGSGLGKPRPHSNTFDEKGNLIRPLSDKELDDLDKP